MEAGGMKIFKGGTLVLLVAAMVLTGGVDAFGFLGFGDSWKEEVLLHDGRKIIVKRSQTYGGRHEIGQSPPVKEHSITFTVPETGQDVSWTSEYGEELGRANFYALALHILDSRPYLVVEPNLCLSYNKWGRPNPPYVIFKYDGATWQRIRLEELPQEFRGINLVISTKGSQRDIEKLASDSGYVPAEGVRKINASLRQPEYKTILREPVKPKTEGSNVNCEALVYYKGAWVGPGDSIGRRMMDQMPK